MSRTAAAARAQRVCHLGARRPCPCPRSCPSVSLRLTPPHRSGGEGGQAIAVASAESWSSSSGMRRLLDPGFQPRQRPREPGLHGALGDPERGRGLLAAELEEVAAGDHEPVLLAQGVDHLEQASAADPVTTYAVRNAICW